MRHRIRERRMELGLTQGQLAEKAGCSRQFINMLEMNDEMSVQSKLLLRIAKALNCTVDSLFYGD